MITGTTKVYAVFGRPVAHSGSPALHNRWFAEHRIDGVYVAIDVPPDRGDAVVDALRTLGFAGCNLTIPHKAAVVPYLDAVDDAVRAIGAANTVVRDGDRLVGHNTDADGFVRSMEDRFPRRLSGARVLVFGAGGAGRAVAFGAAKAGASSVIFANRTPVVAFEAADRLGALLPTTSFAVAALGAVDHLVDHVDVVVNALSGPGADAALAIDPARLPADAVWVDLNYWMNTPPQHKRCHEVGVSFLTGHSMLKWQAAFAFHVFTGVLPDVV